ncbi:MAG: hypothetical protein ACKN81_03295, partial [Pirellulaceae bacterium]
HLAIVGYGEMVDESGWRSCAAIHRVAAVATEEVGTKESARYLPVANNRQMVDGFGCRSCAAIHRVAAVATEEVAIHRVIASQGK